MITGLVMLALKEPHKCVMGLAFILKSLTLAISSSVISKYKSVVFTL